MEAATKNDVYAVVTSRIIAHLEAGTVPWRQPWVDAGIPANLISQKSYRGINLLLLNACGFSRNLFLTFRQARELKATVKKGEKAHPVLFWKWVRRDRDDRRPISELTTKDLRPVLRYYPVFNVEQCSGLPQGILPPVRRHNEPLLACEEVLENMALPPRITHDRHGACYYPGTDTINMPGMDTFASSEAYYGTLFHELVHSTGHPFRLNRREIAEGNEFGSADYSLEELTAEIGASYLSSHAGIVQDDFAGNASYIQGWLKVLKNDRRFVVYASAQAQKAVEFILNEYDDSVND